MKGLEVMADAWCTGWQECGRACEMQSNLMQLLGHIASYYAVWSQDGRAPLE